MDIQNPEKRKWRRQYETKNQAERILEKFGGARRLCEIFKALGVRRSPTSFYKWTYPRDRGGTGGVIPTRCWAKIMEAARYAGVFITQDDLNPLPITKLEPKKHRTEIERIEHSYAKASAEDE